MSMHGLRHRDDGLTLVELMISMLLMAVVGAVMVTLLVGALRSERFEAQADEALSEMRVAKGRVLKEVRFADQIVIANSDEHQVQLWLDLDENGSLTPGTGETVWWTFQADGTLTRADDTGLSEQHAANLVYDAAAGPDSSQFGYDAAGSTITIALVADVDAVSGPNPARIVTTAHVRNM